MNKILIPYAVAIIAQLPMLVIYGRDLWGRAHYRFAPFALLATFAIAYMRWPRNQAQQFRTSKLSLVLLFIALATGVAGYAFMTPWFTACSVLMLIASLLARTIDPETGKSLFSASLPMFVALVLPNNGDFRLITWLQQVSAQLTSRLLDLVGMGHHMPGTIIQIPGKTYNIENACSGVQSFFTLLFVAVVFAVWNRRPWFRSSILVLAAVVWAIFMNTIRILTIPIVDRTFGIDLSSGVSHDLLGYAVLTFGILMLLSTDQFLLFLFGPVEESTGQAGPMGQFLTSFWNGTVAGEDGESSGKRRRKTNKPISPFGRTLIWGTATLLVLIGGIQFIDVVRSYSSPDLKIQFFEANVVQPFTQEDMPSTLETPDAGAPQLWKQVDYHASNRVSGSDLGMRSDSWTYTNEVKLIRTTASLDQTFPGWHELTVCYQNDGWKLVDRFVVEATDADGETWKYIEALLSKETGETGFLLFSHFDAFGNPLDVPVKWDLITSFYNRAKNRLSHRIRGSLFQSEAYQTQVFTAQFGQIRDDQKEAVRQQFLEIRSKMRERFLEKRNDADVVTDASASDAAAPSKP